MEVVRKGCEQELTDHLNSIDTTGSIKFTYEEKSDNSLPFLDTLMIQKEDGTVKLLVYRKKTHTDQYMNFTTHHPLTQKLGGHQNVTECLQVLYICENVHQVGIYIFFPFHHSTSYQSQRTEKKRRSTSPRQ